MLRCNGPRRFSVNFQIAPIFSVSANFCSKSKQESYPAGNRKIHTTCKVTSLGGYPSAGGVPQSQPGGTPLLWQGSGNQPPSGTCDRTDIPPERTWDQRLGHPTERTWDERLGRELGPETGLPPVLTDRHLWKENLPSYFVLGEGKGDRSI